MSPTFFYFIYSFKACDGHPGRLCDTDGWMRASFPWVKYQAPVRPVNSFTHKHIHKLNARKPVWHQCLRISIFIHSLVFPLSAEGIQYLVGGKGNLHFHMGHLRGRWDSSFRSVSGTLLFGWLEPRADIDIWSLLTLSFCGSWGKGPLNNLMEDLYIFKKSFENPKHFRK